MTKEEIYEFINNNKMSNLATVDGDAARVRGMLIYELVDGNIIFHTGKSKDLHKQLQANPNVELCFFNPEANTQIRVSGKATLDEDIELKNKIVEERDFLKPMMEKMGLDSFAVYRVSDLSATIWTPQNNMLPKEYIAL